VDIGVPRETKDGEWRVGLTPDAVRALAARGHDVLVEAGAGARVGLDDAAYATAGAKLAARREDVWGRSLVVKVKELQPAEYALPRAGGVVLAYQQLGRDPRLLDAALASGASFVACEFVRTEDGRRPLLAPMSAIAGLLAPQLAGWALQVRPGPLCGSGVLLAAMDGVPLARVLVVGPGVAGTAAAGGFLDLGCEVAVLGRSQASLSALEARLRGRGRGTLRAAPATPASLEAGVAAADVVVGAVSVPGRLSPRIVTRAMLRAMRPGSVLLDVGIDMGGIAETSRQTTHSDPLYVEERVLHYCVPNIPALVPRAATQALAAATLPYVVALAERGLPAAAALDPALREGVLVHAGAVVHAGLAADTGRAAAPGPFTAP
jgi:alanine dehydrogenase